MDLFASLAKEFTQFQQRHGYKPSKLYMNKHTRDELASQMVCDPTGTNVPELLSWADVPVHLDETLADHQVAFEPEEKTENEPSLLVESV